MYVIPCALRVTCMSSHVLLGLHVCLQDPSYVSTCTRRYTCTHRGTHVHAEVHMSSSANSHMHTCTCLVSTMYDYNIHVCGVYAHTHTHTHIHTHIYTHTRVQSPTTCTLYEQECTLISDVPQSISLASFTILFGV